MVSYYATSNFVEPAGANTALGDGRVRFERLAYVLKWPLPFAIIAISVLVFVLTSRRTAFMPGK